MRTIEVLIIATVLVIGWLVHRARVRVRNVRRYVQALAVRSEESERRVHRLPPAA